MSELLLASNADEDARARAQIGEHDGARLLFDQAVLHGHEWVVGDDQIADGRADLQRVAARYDARSERARLHDLSDSKRRGPLGGRVEVRRIRIGSVVGDGVTVDAEQLIADREFVAHVELDRSADPQKYAVAALEILEPQPAVAPR